jgi:hypothetical protein
VTSSSRSVTASNSVSIPGLSSRLKTVTRGNSQCHSGSRRARGFRLQQIGNQ